ncbi:MAG: CopG family transcriptional regulator [Candidatus Omnitrophica bacterium]|nr:CopG family transcriptional regulator [Candidatus Omnitrophota bacterium]
MKKIMMDKDMPIGSLKRVDDFLPSPADLVGPDKNVKITILLKESSINFFKKEAGKHHTKYQKMIREVLDQYASRWDQAA